MKVWIGFWAASVGDEALAAAHRALYRAWARTLVDHGAVPDERTASRVMAAVDGICLDAVLDPERWPPDEQFKALRAATEAASVGSRSSPPAA